MAQITKLIYIGQAAPNGRKIMKNSLNSLAFGTLVIWTWREALEDLYTSGSFPSKIEASYALTRAGERAGINVFQAKMPVGEWCDLIAADRLNLTF